MIKSKEKSVDKLYLNKFKKKLIFLCLYHDMSVADVARIFNVTRSAIAKVVRVNNSEYKEFLFSNVQREELIK